MKLLAHAIEAPHEEEGADASQDVAEVSAFYLIGAVVVIAIIGFGVWKFLLKK